jgi:ferredoxin-NADP reductase
MRLLDAAAVLTTPLLPDDYLAYVNPLWSRREPRGRVDAVMAESRDCVTLWLRPGSGWPAHVPGQYVRVGVDVDGVRRWRTYSLTSAPGRRDGRIAITVKVVPGGVVSTHLARHAGRGTIVRLAPPAGEYLLPDPVPSRLLFVTAGSGITPVMGMVRELVARGALPEVVLVHVAARPDEVIFGAELRRLARRHREFDLREHHDAVDGRFDPSMLDALCPDWRERPTWACGPSGLLAALTDQWAAHGDAEQLHLERFVRSSSRRASRATADASASPGAAGRSWPTRRRRCWSPAKRRARCCRAAAAWGSATRASGVGAPARCATCGPASCMRPKASWCGRASPLPPAR